MLVLFVFAAAAGLVIGSFLNVCIVRLPLDESLATPRSHCRHCNEQLAWYDNIPVVSYLALAGKCRHCATPISPRYPLVELVTAALFVVLFLRPFPATELALQLAFVSLLVVITFIDIDYLIIPDAITLPSILVAPGLAFFVGHVTVIESMVGILLGGGILWAFASAYERLRGQEGMGFGDVKLLAMIGGVQGWQAVPFSLFVGAMVGALAGTALLAFGRGRLDSAIPFGPFLALGALLHVVAGPEITAWYFAWTGPFG